MFSGAFWYLYDLNLAPKLPPNYCSVKKMNCWLLSFCPTGNEVSGLTNIKRCNNPFRGVDIQFKKNFKSLIF